MSAAAEKAYAAIREGIGTGQFLGGTRLKEASLVEFCGVSRTPVREALQRLDGEGLVTLKPNAGAIVTQWSGRNLQDLYAIRAEIEGMAAAMAAERRTIEQVAELEELSAAMKTLVLSPINAGRADDISRANSKFHAAVLAAAHSQALSATVPQVMDATLMRRTFEKYTQDDLLRSVGQHDDIVAAIATQDPIWARAAMSAHIRAGLNTLEKQARDGVPQIPPG